MPPFDPMIVVNSFMFCQLHGNEYCHLCTCDHRDGNNIVLDLYNTLADNVGVSSFRLQVRTSLNVYSYGAVPVRRSSEDYKCTTHGTKDCERCFDWVNIVRREVQEAGTQERWLERRRRYFERVDRD